MGYCNLELMQTVLLIVAVSLLSAQRKEPWRTYQPPYYPQHTQDVATLFTMGQLYLSSGKAKFTPIKDMNETSNSEPIMAWSDNVWIFCWLHWDLSKWCICLVATAPGNAHPSMHTLYFRRSCKGSCLALSHMEQKYPVTLCFTYCSAHKIFIKSCATLMTHDKLWSLVQLHYVEDLQFKPLPRRFWIPRGNLTSN